MSVNEIEEKKASLERVNTLVQTDATKLKEEHKRYDNIIAELRKNNFLPSEKQDLYNAMINSAKEISINLSNEYMKNTEKVISRSNKFLHEITRANLSQSIKSILNDHDITIIPNMIYSINLYTSMKFVKINQCLRALTSMISLRTLLDEEKRTGIDMSCYKKLEWEFDAPRFTRELMVEDFDKELEKKNYQFK